jgi:hypothetical protein
LRNQSFGSLFFRHLLLDRPLQRGS